MLANAGPAPPRARSVCFSPDTVTFVPPPTRTSSNFVTSPIGQACISANHSPKKSPALADGQRGRPNAIDHLRDAWHIGKSRAGAKPAGPQRGSTPKWLEPPKSNKARPAHSLPPHPPVPPPPATPPATASPLHPPAESGLSPIGGQRHGFLKNSDRKGVAKRRARVWALSLDLTPEETPGRLGPP